VAPSETERIIPTLSPQINALPSLTPTIYDDSAPDPQKCPGYKASNVAENEHGFTADLTIAGANCQAFGTDIADLTLEVSYQAKERLNVRIHPKYIDPKNSTQYILPADLVEQPKWDGKTSASCSDLKFEWSNDPTFQFKVLRSSTGEELFSTYGHVIVYEDQFLELVTNMVEVSDFARFVSIHLMICAGLQCIWSCREHPQLPPWNELYSDFLRCRCR
jgi:alpha-glucosidase